MARLLRSRLQVNAALCCGTHLPEFDVTLRLFLTVGLATFALHAPAAHAQSEPANDPAFHARVAQVITELAAGRALPRGDTLLSWSPKLSLFHVIGGSADSLRSALLRWDELLGITETRWAGGAPVYFETHWTRGDSTLVALSGHREGAVLRITGSRDTMIVLPELPWAVADYGMDEQLVPLIATFTPAREPRPMAVLRPYLMKWDTVVVTVDLRVGVRVATTVSGKTRQTLVIPADRRLIWARRSDAVSELRPLEGSARHAEFVGLRAELGTLP